jgi:hypothetical protein
MRAGENGGGECGDRDGEYGDEGGECGEGDYEDGGGDEEGVYEMGSMRTRVGGRNRR